MKTHCYHCHDTGSLSKDINGILDCPFCGIARERAELERWALRNGIRTKDGDLWMIYEHGKQAGRT